MVYETSCAGSGLNTELLLTVVFGKVLELSGGGAWVEEVITEGQALKAHSHFMLTATYLIFQEV